MGNTFSFSPLSTMLTVGLLYMPWSFLASRMSDSISSLQTINIINFKTVIIQDAGAQDQQSTVKGTISMKSRKMIQRPASQLPNLGILWVKYLRMNEDKFIVKATIGPILYIVGYHCQFQKSNLNPGTRVSLDMITMIFAKIH